MHTTIRTLAGACCILIAVGTVDTVQAKGLLNLSLLGKHGIHIGVGLGGKHGIRLGVHTSIGGKKAVNVGAHVGGKSHKH